MAKRFISTDIFMDPWFSDLPAKYKLAWIFTFTNCNHAGIWKVNYKLLNFAVGDHIEPSECERHFKGRIIKLEDERFWFIPNFITFQYGNILNPKNRAHKSVIKELANFGVIHNYDENVDNEEGGIDFLRTFQGLKDKDKDKDKDKVKEKEKENVLTSGSNLTFAPCIPNPPTLQPSNPITLQPSNPTSRTVHSELTQQHYLVEWISINAPKVNKLKHPLTADECARLLEEFGEDEVKEVLLEMENYRKLLPSYENANLTLRKWLKIRKESKPFGKARTANPEVNTPFTKYWKPGDN